MFQIFILKINSEVIVKINAGIQVGGDLIALLKMGLRFFRF